MGEKPAVEDKPFRVDPRLTVKVSRKSFYVDDRIIVKMEFDLAVRVGEILLAHPTPDKMVKALGHQLVNLEGKE
jgi:hypothetical protein